MPSYKVIAAIPDFYGLVKVCPNSNFRGLELVNHVTSQNFIP